MVTFVCSVLATTCQRVVLPVVTTTTSDIFSPGGQLVGIHGIVWKGIVYHGMV